MSAVQHREHRVELQLAVLAVLPEQQPVSPARHAEQSLHYPA
jgi:hypothetical protein